jgi:hypothetical protein
LCDVDGVDHQQTLDAGNMREQGEPLRVLNDEYDIDEYDIGRDARVALQGVDGVNADAIVAMDKIGEASTIGFGQIRSAAFLRRTEKTADGSSRWFARMPQCRGRGNRCFRENRRLTRAAQIGAQLDYNRGPKRRAPSPRHRIEESLCFTKSTAAAASP